MKRPRLSQAARRVLCSALCVVAMHAHAVSDDANQPIHISGDDASIDQGTQKLVYHGNVRIDQGTLRVTASEMVVEYAEQKVVRITALGAPARYQQELENNQGFVRANARKIVYHTQAEAIDLLGRALLVQHGNELRGERIRYDIVAGKVDATSEADAPVRMILKPAAR